LRVEQLADVRRHLLAELLGRQLVHRHADDRETAWQETVAAQV